jgi:hypothetical protein
MTGMAPARQTRAPASMDRVRPNISWPRAPSSLTNAVPMNPAAPVTNAVTPALDVMWPVWNATDPYHHPQRPYGTRTESVRSGASDGELFAIKAGLVRAHRQPDRLARSLDPPYCRSTYFIRRRTNANSETSPLLFVDSTSPRVLKSRRIATLSE